VDGTPNDSHSQTGEEQGIPVSKGIVKMLGWKDAGENGCRLLQNTQIPHMYIMSSKKKNITLRSYTLKKFSC
jgi:hypothetical protein